MRIFPKFSYRLFRDFRKIKYDMPCDAALGKIN
jgi:hypothetical protein